MTRFKKHRTARQFFAVLFSVLLAVSSFNMAAFADEPIYHTVTFSLDGIGSDAPPSQQIADGGLVTKPEDPSAEGYHFDGWVRPAGSEDYWDFEKDTVDEDILLSAKWTCTTYTVCFDANGGEGSMDDQKIPLDTPTDLTKNAFTRTNYYFVGWCTKADGSVDLLPDNKTVENLTTEPGGRVTLYAQWGGDSYFVSFNKNGDAEGTMDNQIFYFGTTQSLTPNAYTWGGKMFRGWNTASDGSGTWYEDGASVVDLAEKECDNVVLYAQWEDSTGMIPYLAEDGVTTKYCSSYTVIDSETINNNQAALTDWNGSWYVAFEDVTINSQITVSDDVNLILINDSTLTVNEGILVEAGNSLKIWAQSADESSMGALTASVSSESTEPGIGGGGTVTINGGKITASGGYNGTDYAAGIGIGISGEEGTVIINNGIVNATSQGDAAAIGGGHDGVMGRIIINGGTVTAAAKETGAGIGGNSGTSGELIINGGTVQATGGTGNTGISNSAGTVTINGGTVTATAGAGASCIGSNSETGETITINGGNVTAVEDGDGFGIGNTGGGEITLGWTNSADTITASGYQTKSGYLTIVDGKSFFVTGPDEMMIGNFFGKVLCEAYSGDESVSVPALYTVQYDKNGGRGSMDDQIMNCGIKEKLNANTFTRENYVFTGWTENQDGSGNVFGDEEYVTDAAGVNETKTLYARWTPETGNAVPYLSADGNTIRYCDTYTKLSTYSELTLTEGWYVVDSDIVFDFINRPVISGDVNLILCDGTTLTAKAGIDVHFEAEAQGDGTNINKLTIWAQSTGEDAGKLVAEKDSEQYSTASAIGAGYTGIDGGDITINGGVITASVNTGGNICGAAIGGGPSGAGGNITINGGSVTATCEDSASGAAIGGGSGDTGGNITINGGTVKAQTFGNGACIGGGVNGAGGNITINGGTVTVINTGEDGAGIGGGSGCPGGDITINGGSIDASAYNNGAGIGGGANGAGGNVTINGGTVNAAGGNAGAGIGGGFQGDGGTIIINGGTVDADGRVNQSGAGIGGGSEGAAGTIIINGGDVNGAGSGAGAGIGCGARGTGGSITINGGNVEAHQGMGAGMTGTGGSIEIGCTNTSDSIYASGYSSESGTVTVSGDQVLAYYDEEGECKGSYSGAVTCTDIAGKTLVPYKRTITVNTSSNGTVTADKTTASVGETVTLKVTPDTGYRLKKLTVRKAIEENAVSGGVIPTVQVNSYTYTFKMPNESVAVEAVFSELAEPEFIGHALLLSGYIGVQYKVCFPSDFDADDMKEVYMTFQSSAGRTSSMAIDEAEESDNNCYYFTCYVNPLEIGDTITATIHYLKSYTKKNEYSAYKYCSYVKKYSDSYADTLLPLVNSLLDYGHYMQQSGWTDGMGSHTAVDAVSELNDESIAAAITNLSGQDAVFSLDDTGISKATFSLSINSGTKINIFLKPEDGVTITSASPEFTEITRSGERWYQYTTDSIGVKNLGEMLEIRAETNTGGIAEVRVSPMSYVKAVLESSSGFTTAQKYAMTAYYNYYAAVQNFVNQS